MLLRKLSSLTIARVVYLLICLSVIFQVEAAFAEQSQAQASDIEQDLAPQESEALLAAKAAIHSSTHGPDRITLIDQGSLDIPENYLFVPKKEASDLMKAIGNETNSTFVGLLLSDDNEFRWFITVDFIDSGYLRDTDAKNWSADDLMKTLKEGNDEANKRRIKDGFPALEIIDWIESPKYDVSKHQLIWSILAKENDSSDSVVNYNTYVLGREGYFELNLITGNSTIAQYKKNAHTMLASLHYNDGKRYQDFSEGTDRVAKYGLTALITGVAAKKLGLLALAGAFFVKMWKLAIIIPIALLGMLKKIFKGSSSSTPEN